MLVIHGTKEFRERVRGLVATSDDSDTTHLGPWYATVLFWKPQVALFVNEATLLPVLMPLAPAATITARFPAALASLLAMHGVDSPFVDAETRMMSDTRIDKTASRSVLGSMNEFAFLAEARPPLERADLLSISVELAGTPCGRKGQGYTFPDRALHARIAETGVR